MIGRKYKVQVDVAGKPDGSEEDTYVERAMLEKKTDSLHYENSQLLSQAIVFGCLHRQVCPDLNTFAPTVGISKDNVIFYFNDSVRDILIESSIFDLFYDVKIAGDFRKCHMYDTILALWLTLNYKPLATGVTQGMVDRTDYRANFWVQLPDGAKAIYEKELQFGHTRTGVRYVKKMSPYRHLSIESASEIQNKLGMSNI